MCICVGSTADSEGACSEVKLGDLYWVISHFFSTRSRCIVYVWACMYACMHMHVYMLQSQCMSEGMISGIMVCDVRPWCAVCDLWAGCGHSACMRSMRSPRDLIRDLARPHAQAREGSPQWLVDETDRIRRGLMTLRQNVVLVRDPEDKDAFYPRCVGPPHLIRAV